MPPKDKAAPAGKWYDQINDPWTLLIFIFILATAVTALLTYLSGLNIGSTEFIWFRIKNYFLLNIWPIWKIVSAVLSAIAIYGIAHNLRKLTAINREENTIFNPVTSEILVVTPEEAATIKKFERNEKWERVIGYMNSINPSDWRLAIMEADVMLEELLRTIGLHGDSVGEMLKSADINEFGTLNDAWEAHKVRNAIAHAGSGFDLNERETKRVIALFEKVFKEFGII